MNGKNDFKMELPESVLTAERILNGKGFECYAVGGCVRDSLLLKKPSDYDVTTSALPEEVEKCFDGYRIIETGIKHGTVTVLIGNDQIEITTFRIDGDYLDNRHPEKVYFSRKLADDLSRRDFTVNAMAYSSKSGLVDIFGGVRHLDEKKIVSVGNPYDRFHEDGLRILRALRFASVLGFEIEEETSKYVLSERKLLKNISSERIYSEFTKLIAGKNAKDILLSYRKVIEEFCDIPFDGSEYEKRCSALHLLPTNTERLAMLFGSEENAHNNLLKLKTDNYTLKRVSVIARYSDILIESDRISVRKIASSLGFDALKEIFELKKALGEDVSEAEKEAGEIEKDKDCIFIKDLEITGNDLISLGISGKEIGKVLSDLLSSVIEEKTVNKKGDLLEYAEKIINTTKD